MYAALRQGDSSYDGVFFVAVRTTGIFCRPTCPAKTPRRENVEFYPSVRDALSAGYRPCLRCRPLEPNGQTPEWLQPLLKAVEDDPARRWTDDHLRALAIDPGRIRRWFRTHHGMTFHAYQRARRLGLALGRIRHGSDLSRAAYEHGYESLSGFRDAFERVIGQPPGRSRGAVSVAMTRILTPLGPVVAGATEDGVCLLEFADRPMLETQMKRLRRWLRCAFVPGCNQHIEQLDRELRNYFAGTLKEFSVPLVAPGTDFQRRVWDRLLQIPYGETRTYDQLAHAVARPGAHRAVGRANGDNRLAVIIPCHRVVGSNGELRGYGGGKWRKQQLIDHERERR